MRRVGWFILLLPALLTLPAWASRAIGTATSKTVVAPATTTTVPNDMKMRVVSVNPDWATLAFEIHVPGWKLNLRCIAIQGAGLWCYVPKGT